MTETEPKNSTVKYNIWKCISCPNECILPFNEPYDNPHVCPSNEEIEADFRHEEICESDLLSKFLRVDTLVIE